MLKILSASSSSISTVCDFLGCEEHNNGVISPNGNLNTQLSNIIKWGLSAIFVGIIIFGIFLTIKAVVTIINSEGVESKVEEGTKIFKGIFIGLGIMLVGIVGLFLLIAFFQAGGILNQQVTPPGGVKIPVINQ